MCSLCIAELSFAGSWRLEEGLNATEGYYGSPDAACAYVEQVTDEGVGEDYVYYTLIPVGADGYECQMTEHASGSSYIDGGVTYLLCSEEGDLGLDIPNCGEEEEDKPAECLVGNPVSIASGYKFQREAIFPDFREIELDLVYRWNLSAGNWRLPYQQYLNLAHSPAAPLDSSHYVVLEVQRPDNSVLEFKGILNQPLVTDGDVLEQLSPVFSAGQVEGWRLTLADDSVERYSATGELESITDRAGRELLVSYEGNSQVITAPYSGEQLTITTLSASELDITTPDGELYRFNLNASGLIASIIFPDTTPASSSDNPERIYHYEDINFPQALTGITDERGVRFATWDYDSASGRAITSKHEPPSAMIGIDQVSLDFTDAADPDDPRTVTTNEFGQTRTYHFQQIEGVRKVTWIERDSHTNSGDPTVGCVDAERYTSYDENGFVDTEVDWRGNAVDYDYDVEGRETYRVEGLAGSVDTTDVPPTISTAYLPETREISTYWHPKFRLPTRIEDYEKVMDLTYDCDNGRLLNRQVYTPGFEPGYTEPSCP